MRVGVYGEPPLALAPAPRDVVRFSPFDPEAATMEAEADGGFDSFIVAAPAGSLERRYVLAQALRLLKPGGDLLALAPKDRGGARLAKELAAFGCEVHQTAKAHHKICRCTRPEAPVGVADAIHEGGPQVPHGLGLWSQPGVFSWDRLDRGTALLIEMLPGFAGRGVDLGCGYGALGLAALKSDAVSEMLLVDTDGRAIAAARRNIHDPRARFLHADGLEIEGDYDFAVINPPFHVAGEENRGLGQSLAQAAYALIRKGGTCLVVANVTLPYERALESVGAKVRQLARRDGFKVLEATR